MIFEPAGIDVHKKIQVVLVTDVEIESEYQFDRRMFGSNPEHESAGVNYSRRSPRGSDRSLPG